MGRGAGVLNAAALNMTNQGIERLAQPRDVMGLRQPVAAILDQLNLHIAR